MRQLFVILGLVVLAAIPAGCMSDDEQDARRPAAMGAQEERSYSHARLSIGGIASLWGSFNWGVSADVIESRATDAEGRPIYRLNAGPTRPGKLTLERGFDLGSSDRVELFTGGQLQFKEATLTLIETDGSPLATYTLSGVVLADLKHEVRGTNIFEVLALRFTGTSLAPA